MAISHYPTLVAFAMATVLGLVTAARAQPAPIAVAQDQLVQRSDDQALPKDARAVTTTLDHACRPQLDELQRTWSNLLPVSPSKPSPSVVQSRGGPTFSGPDYNYMVHNFRRAGADCAAGREHEAMLRMDTIRSIMKLPPVPHPASHNYLAAQH